MVWWSRSTGGAKQRMRRVLITVDGTSKVPKAHFVSPKSTKPRPAAARTRTTVPPVCGPPRGKSSNRRMESHFGRAANGWEKASSWRTSVAAGLAIEIVALPCKPRDVRADVDGLVYARDARNAYYDVITLQALYVWIEAPSFARTDDGRRTRCARARARCDAAPARPGQAGHTQTQRTHAGSWHGRLRQFARRC